MPDTNHISSSTRVLQVFELFAESPERLTLTELTNQIGSNRTTVWRFLHTLSAMGYLTRDENKRYALGMKILAIAPSTRKALLELIYRAHFQLAGRIGHLNSSFSSILYELCFAFKNILLPLILNSWVEGHKYVGSLGRSR